LSLNFRRFSLQFQCQSPCAPLSHLLKALENGWTNKECTFDTLKPLARTVYQYLEFCKKRLQFPLQNSILALYDDFIDDSYKNFESFLSIYLFHLAQIIQMIWMRANSLSLILLLRNLLDLKYFIFINTNDNIAPNL